MRTHMEPSSVTRASAARGALRQLAGIAIAAGTLGCLDSAGPPPIVREPPTPSPVTFVAAVARIALDVPPIVYVSLASGSIPDGVQARLRIERTAATAVTPVIDGGFDPVGLPAVAGDTIAIEVLHADGGRGVAVRVPVKPEAPPMIVRTVPPPHKRDVPLNNLISVVFSEPIEPSALSAAAIQLRTDGVAVEGRLEFTDATRTVIAFVPAATLLAFRNYELVVTQAILDASGTPLGAPASVPFRTGPAPAPAVAARISILIGPSLPLGVPHHLAGIVQDAAGAVIADVPITWSTDDASIVSVDAVAGVITGRSLGTTTVRARARGLSSEVPVTVLGFRSPQTPGLLSFSQIGTVGNFSCGIEAVTDLAYCWGDNHQGALGAGEGDGTDGPLLVAGPLRLRSISVGYYTTCGIESGTGLAYCWGGSWESGTTTRRWVPALVADGGMRFSAISTSGGATCGVEAVTSRGFCWKGRTVPLPVDGGEIRFASISTSDSHGCGIEAGTGRAYCWGLNRSGQLGDGTAETRPAPTLVADGRIRFGSISASERVTCGVEAETGRGYCWGSNLRGQLGDGTTTERLLPALVGGGTPRFASIDAGTTMSCGVEAGSGVGYCWGLNDVGSLGVGSPADRLLPAMVASGQLRFSGISVDGGRPCGVEVRTGIAYCWGPWTFVPEPIAPPAPTASMNRSQ